MSKIIEVTLYEYDELNANAKAKARNHYIEHLTYDWWDCVYEEAMLDGKELGFEIDQINFSGFYSQGDGARWTGRVNVPKWLESHAPDCIGASALIALITEGWVEKFVSVRSVGGNYCHEQTMDVAELDYDNRFYDTDELDEIELESETIGALGIFNGMSLANMRDIINTDETNPYKLSNIHALNKDIEDSAKDYAKQIYNKLEEEWDFLCTEEVVRDYFNNNDFYFTKEGVAQ